MMAHRPERSVRQAHNTNDWLGATPSTGMWVITNIQRRSCPSGQYRCGSLAPSMITHHTHVHAALLGPPAPAGAPLQAQAHVRNRPSPPLPFPEPQSACSKRSCFCFPHLGIAKLQPAGWVSTWGAVVMLANVYVTPRNNPR